MTLAGAIRYLASSVLQTNAPESVHIAVTRRGDHSYMVSLVNHTSATARPLRSLIPVSDLGLTLGIGEPERFEVLRSEGEVSFSGQAGRCLITLSRLQEFCSLVVTTASTVD